MTLDIVAVSCPLFGYLQSTEPAGADITDSAAKRRRVKLTLIHEMGKRIAADANQG